MNLESGPVVNIEQRRLAPIIESTLEKLVANQPYFIDSGIYDGFSGDEPRIVALKYAFLEPTSLKLSVSAVHQDRSETKISADLAESIASAVNHSLDEADIPFVALPNPKDTTIHTYFTMSRTSALQ